MKCRYCAGTDSKVIDSRPTEDGSAIRRRRECINCGRRFTTYEKIEELPIMVVKRDGRREPYDSEKVRAGIRKACEKRPVAAAEQDKLVEDITREVYNTLASEISTTDIGEMVRLVKEAKDIPCAVGFGISTPEQAAEMCRTADGVIVGSAIVKLCGANGRACVPFVRDYVRKMSEAVK